MKAIETKFTKSYKGITCKVCNHTGFGQLFRLSVKGSKWVCYKCLEEAEPNAIFDFNTKMYSIA